MSDKSIDEIANEIWQMGYNAGYNAEKQAEYERGYQAALDEMSRWLAPNSESPSAQEGPAKRAPGRTRTLEWLKGRPDGASHAEMVEAGVSRDNAALWRLKQGGYARQDPETLRYYAVDQSDA